jgi:hypothetical protein
MNTRLLIYLNLILLYSLSGLEIFLTYGVAGLERIVRFVGERGFRAWKRDADLRFKAGL